MSRDIGRLLGEWSVDDPAVRVIKGDDGRPKIQRRLALGIMQLEMAGRPDGQRPEGEESYFAYFQKRARREAEAFFLTNEDCQRLAAESLLYFQRRICLFDLGEFDLAAKDADRNLDVFSFARRHALDEEDAWVLDQYRGFVLSHRARARALGAIQRSDYAAALALVDEAVGEIQDFLDEYQIDEEMAAGDEIRQLRKLRDQISGDRRPEAPNPSMRDLLTEQLRAAVKNEHYERAAQIRDRLAALDPPRR